MQLGWGRLGRVPMRFPFDILRALHQLAADKRSDPNARLPRVRIELLMRSYDGCVLSIMERNDGTLVLFRGDGLTYLFIGLQEAFNITVFEPEDYLTLLGGDASARWSSDEPLSALQARRAMAEVESKFAQAGVALDVSAAIVTDASVANNTVRDVATALHEWWLAQRSDAVGAEVVQGLKRLVFASGESKVMRDGDALVVGIGKSGYASKEALVKAVEAAL